MAFLSTRNMQWHKDARSFICEISDLPEKRIPLKRVFQDSCDEGFTLVSEWTGQELDFFLNETVTKEGDVMLWKFLPVQKNGPVSEVVIFND